MADYLQHAATRKRKIRENETLDQRTKRLARDHESKTKRRAAETAEKRKERLNKENNQKRQRRVLNKECILKDANERLNYRENEQKFVFANYRFFL